MSRSYQDHDPVRIALVAHYLPPHEGGIERVVAHLADGYQAAGVTPVLVGWGSAALAAASTPHPTRSLRGWNGLERHGVPVPLVAPAHAWRTLSEVIAGCDGVHVHGLPYPASVLALTVAGRHRVPAVVTEHVGSIPYRNVVLSLSQAVAMRIATGVASRTCTGVAILNDRVAAELRPLVGTVPLHKIPNGVDATLFRPADEETRLHLRDRLGLQGPTIVGVGRNVAKKGLRALVEAAAGGVADVVLVGAGTSTLAGPGCRSIEVLAQTELADLYRAADLLVLPSVGEGLPLVVQEALASGLPVVMGDDPAVRAELPEGPIRFVDPADVAGLRRTIVGLLADPELANLRATARQEALERYDWDRTVASYLDLFGLRPPA